MNVTKKITVMALFCALMAVSAQIAIPTSPPFTLQTFVMFLAVGVIGTKCALGSVCAYLTLGTLGVPVFSGFRGGLSVLFEGSGGYLVGFVLTVIASGLILDRFGRKKRVMAAAFSIGMAVCYIFGSAWYYFVLMGKSGSVGILAIFVQCVLVFLPLDAVKIAAAVLVSDRLRKVAIGL